MSLFIIIISICLAVAVLVLAAFLLTEVIAALPPLREAEEQHASGKIAVIVPAHNESEVIAATVNNIREQLRETDRLLVVADNCHDDTADRALQYGAEVVIRKDPDRRGKGYALQFGVDALRAAPPEIVVFVDADCVFEDGALQKIAALATDKGRPVQALYLMKAPQDAGPRLQVAEFAWGFINQTRMRGLQRLFDVARFTGSGFAVPWRQIEHISLASDEIVEDLTLTFQLARAGAAPMLAHGAVLESEFPAEERALARQSARWSLGSLRFAMKSALSLVVEGVKARNFQLLGAALDLLIPPLTVFVGIEIAIALVGLVAWFATGVSAPFAISFWALTMTACSVALGWAWFGREALPPSALGGVAAFLAAKANVFGRSGRESARRWTPTRGGDDAGPRS